MAKKIFKQSGSNLLPLLLAGPQEHNQNPQAWWQRWFTVSLGIIKEKKKANCAWTWKLYFSAFSNWIRFLARISGWNLEVSQEVNQLVPIPGHCPNRADNITNPERQKWFKRHSVQSEQHRSSGRPEFKSWPFHLSQTGKFFQMVSSCRICCLRLVCGFYEIKCIKHREGG